MNTANLRALVEIRLWRWSGEIRFKLLEQVYLIFDIFVYLEVTQVEHHTGHFYFS